MRAYERLLDYVRVYTTSDPESGTHPSAAREFDLAHKLVEELKEVMATTRRLVAERGEHFNADWVANEVRFHRCYMLYCGNARVVKMHQDLGTNRITFLAYLGVNHTPLKLSTLECNLMEHQAIVDAIAAADSARFINAVTRHIARATDDYATDDECRAKAARIKALKAKYEV